MFSISRYQTKSWRLSILWIKANDTAIWFGNHAYYYFENFWIIFLYITVSCYRAKDNKNYPFNIEF